MHQQLQLQESHSLLIGTAVAGLVIQNVHFFSHLSSSLTLLSFARCCGGHLVIFLPEALLSLEGGLFYHFFSFCLTLFGLVCIMYQAKVAACLDYESLFAIGSFLLQHGGQLINFFG